MSDKEAGSPEVEKDGNTSLPLEGRIQLSDANTLKQQNNDESSLLKNDDTTVSAKDIPASSENQFDPAGAIILANATTVTTPLTWANLRFSDTTVPPEGKEEEGEVHEHLQDLVNKNLNEILDSEEEDGMGTELSSIEPSLWTEKHEQKMPNDETDTSQSNLETESLTMLHKESDVTGQKAIFNEASEESSLDHELPNLPPETSLLNTIPSSNAIPNITNIENGDIEGPPVLINEVNALEVHVDVNSSSNKTDSVIAESVMTSEVFLNKSHLKNSERFLSPAINTVGTAVENEANMPELNEPYQNAQDHQVINSTSGENTGEPAPVDVDKPNNSITEESVIPKDEESEHASADTANENQLSAAPEEMQPAVQDRTPELSPTLTPRKRKKSKDRAHIKKKHIEFNDCEDKPSGLIEEDYTPRTLRTRRSIRNASESGGQRIWSKVCKCCDNDFKNEDEYSWHVVVHIGKEPGRLMFRCPSCCQCYDAVNLLKTHLTNMHSIDAAVVCNKCDRPFRNRSELDMHLTSEHSSKAGARVHRKIIIRKPTVKDEKRSKKPKPKKEEVNDVADGEEAVAMAMDDEYDEATDVDEPNCDETNAAELNTVTLEAEVEVKEEPEESGDDEEVDVTYSPRKRNRRPSNKGSPKFTCKTCGNGFTNLKQYREHSRRCVRASDKLTKASVRSQPSDNTSECHEETPGTDPAHKCHVCSMTFAHKDELDAHVTVHSGRVKVHECKQCEKTFRQLSMLRKHEKTHTDTRPHECEKCARRFRARSELRLHMRQHDNDRPFRCTEPGCDKAYARRSHLNQHMRVHTTVKPEFMCHYCNEEFQAEDEWKGHESSHQGHEKPYSCAHCSDQFADERVRTEHEISQHNEIREHKCDFCGEIFLRRSLLINHLATHKGEKIFKCDDCTKAFSTAHSLRKHRLTHSQRYDLACEYCGKMFRDSRNLRVHQMTHTGEKPHGCSVCDKRFITAGELKMHMRVHTGEKPNTCEYCGMVFSQKGNLARHLLRHTGERPLKCEICGKGFIEKQELNAHVLNHNGLKPFKCEVCSLGFTRKHHLKKHYRTHTGVKPHACEYCGKSFAERYNLLTHRVIHTGVKPHPCPYCNNGFIRRGHLVKHVKEAHPDEELDDSPKFYIARHGKNQQGAEGSVGVTEQNVTTPVPLPPVTTLSQAVSGKRKGKGRKSATHSANTHGLPSSERHANSTSHVNQLAGVSTNEQLLLNQELSRKASVVNPVLLSAATANLEEKAREALLALGLAHHQQQQQQHHGDTNLLPPPAHQSALTQAPTTYSHYATSTGAVVSQPLAQTSHVPMTSSNIMTSQSGHPESALGGCEAYANNPASAAAAAAAVLFSPQGGALVQALQQQQQQQPPQSPALPAAVRYTATPTNALTNSTPGTGVASTGRSGGVVSNAESASVVAGVAVSEVAGSSERLATFRPAVAVTQPEITDYDSLRTVATHYLNAAVANVDLAALTAAAHVQAAGIQTANSAPAVVAVSTSGSGITVTGSSGYAQLSPALMQQYMQAAGVGVAGVGGAVSVQEGLLSHMNRLSEMQSAGATGTYPNPFPL